MCAPINADELKQAMRTWITGVAIVTGCHAGKTHGMTVNSFTSISLTPPTVLVALQQDTRTDQVINSAGAFAVTILDASQKNLARRFSGQLGDEQSRFHAVETFTFVSGAPLIKGGLAFFDCKVVNQFPVGLTTVYLGEVLAAQTQEDRNAPLLYFNRNWRKLAEE